MNNEFAWSLRCVLCVSEEYGARRWVWFPWLSQRRHLPSTLAPPLLLPLLLSLPLPSPASLFLPSLPPFLSPFPLLFSPSCLCVRLCRLLMIYSAPVRLALPPLADGDRLLDPLDILRGARIKKTKIEIVVRIDIERDMGVKLWIDIELNTYLLSFKTDSMCHYHVKYEYVVYKYHAEYKYHVLVPYTNVYIRVVH